MEQVVTETGQVVEPTTGTKGRIALLGWRHFVRRIEGVTSCYGKQQRRPNNR